MEQVFLRTHPQTSMTAGTVLHVIFDVDILQQTRYVVEGVFQFRIYLPLCKIRNFQFKNGQIGPFLRSSNG